MAAASALASPVPVPGCLGELGHSSGVRAAAARFRIVHDQNRHCSSSSITFGRCPRAAKSARSWPGLHLGELEHCRRRKHARADATQTGQSTSGEGKMQLSPSQPSPLQWPLPKTWHQPGTKMSRLPGLAAGFVAALAGVQVGGAVTESLEAVPFLPQAELLIGTLVTANLAIHFLSGGEGRARVESFIEELVDRVQGRKDLDADPSEPSMLDVQLRSVLDEHLREIRDDSGLLSTVTSKAGLVQALKAFISARESKSRRINAVLRKDVETLAAAKAKLRDAKQTLSCERELAAAAASQLADVMTRTSAIEVEKDVAVEKVAALSHQLDVVSSQLEVLVHDRQRAEDLNEQLRSRLSESEANKAALERSLRAVEDASAAAGSRLETLGAQHKQELDSQKQELVEQARRAQHEQAVNTALQHQLDTELASYTSERKRWVEATSRLETELGELQVHIEERDIQLAGLEEELSGARRAGDTDKEAVSNLEAQLQLAQADLAHAESTHKSLQAALHAEQQKRQVPEPSGDMKMAPAHQEQAVAAAESDMRNIVRTTATTHSGHNGTQGAEFPPDKPSLAELRAYCRTEGGNFIDFSKPAKEQEAGIGQLVQALVARGATYGWASKYIVNYMKYERQKRKDLGGQEV